MSENTVRFDLSVWKRIEQIGVCASPDDARPILCCVHVEPGKNELTVTATDSYRLATTTIENVECEPFDSFLLPAKPIKDVRIAVGKVKELGKNPSILVTVDLHTAKVEALTTEKDSLFSQTIRLVDGNYPDYKVLFPDAPEDHNAAFNAAYVSSMAVAAGSDDAYPVEFHVRGPLEPVLFTSRSDENWRGLVMPVRV